MRLVCLLVLLFGFAGCKTVQNWKDFVEEQVKGQVRVVAEAQIVKVNRWTEEGGWQSEIEVIPAGYYIFPPFPELIGLER